MSRRCLCCVNSTSVSGGRPTQRIAHPLDRDDEPLAAAGLFDGEILTEVLPATPFYLASERHQNFCTKNPERYEKSHAASGRSAFFQAVWGTREARR